MTALVFAAVVFTSTMVPPTGFARDHDFEALKSLEVVGIIAAPSRFTPDDTLRAAARARHSREVRCIFTAEIGGGTTRGGVRYEPYDPHMPHGDSATFGPGGLAEYGLYPQFRAWGYTNPEDPYQVAGYIDRVLDERRGGNWHYLAERLRNGSC